MQLSLNYIKTVYKDQSKKNCDQTKKKIVTKLKKNCGPT